MRGGRLLSLGLTAHPPPAPPILTASACRIQDNYSLSIKWSLISGILLLIYWHCQPEQEDGGLMSARCTPNNALIRVWYTYFFHPMMHLAASVWNLHHIICMAVIRIILTWIWIQTRLLWICNGIWIQLTFYEGSSFRFGFIFDWMDFLKDPFLTCNVLLGLCLSYPILFNDSW